MNDSIIQFNNIIRGNDGAQNVSKMYDRIALPESQKILERALQVRAFFSQGWFRLWRKNVLDSKVNLRDSRAFDRLHHLEQFLSGKLSRERP